MPPRIPDLRIIGKCKLCKRVDKLEENICGFCVKRSENKYNQLVEDLKYGDLTMTQVQIAIRAALRERKDIPDGIKDILCGRGASDTGIISKAFRLIDTIIGSMELAYRRGAV